MGHTNSTANLSLPQFIGTDKPTWLGDVNGAFSAIDSYAGTNDAAVAAAVSDASSAISQAAAAVNTANTANTTAGNASTAANNAIGVANTANAIAGTVDAKVGLLADLNTTDRTSIVNAINEVNGKDAGDIAYDNSGSGLTATNVQAAIDEIAQGGGSQSISVTADGVKTVATLLDELYALIDSAQITDKAVLVYKDTNERIAHLAYESATEYRFTTERVSSTYLEASTFAAKASSSTWVQVSVQSGSAAFTDQSSTVPTSGIKITIIY